MREALARRGGASRRARCRWGRWSCWTGRSSRAGAQRADRASDPTAHAEVVALRAAGRERQLPADRRDALRDGGAVRDVLRGRAARAGRAGRLRGARTRRPARWSRCTGSSTTPRLNHRIAVTGGVLAGEAARRCCGRSSRRKAMIDSRRGGRARLKASDSKSDRGPEGPSGVQILSPSANFPQHVLGRPHGSPGVRNGGVTERPKVRHWKCRARANPVPWVQIPPPPPSFSQPGAADRLRVR